MKVETFRKQLDREAACERCGYLEKLEIHHRKPKIEGGKDKTSNYKVLCRGCHDYEHARRTVMKAIEAEKRRLVVLETRLSIIEKENTPESIQKRGYQSYFEIYNDPLPESTRCASK